MVNQIPIDLYVLADQVDNEESFLRFVSALAADWEEEQRIEAVKPSEPYSSGALGWENGTVGAVLEVNDSFSALGLMRKVSAGAIAVHLYQNAYAKVPLCYESLPVCFTYSRIEFEPEC